MVVKPKYDPLHNDFRYISYLQKQSTEHDFIIIKDDGTIIGLTKQITEYFGWLPRDFEHNQIYIQNLIPSLYDIFASIYLMKAFGEKPDFDQILNTIKLKINLSGFFRCRCYNNKLPLSPYPSLSMFMAGDMKVKTRKEIEKKFVAQKEKILKVVNNLNNKYDIEFLLDHMSVGNHNKHVFIMKIKTYLSLDKEVYMPIRSYYCKKVCRLMLFYIKFKRLLKKVRARKQKKKFFKEMTIKNRKTRLKSTGNLKLDSLLDIPSVNNKAGEQVSLAELLATGVVKANLLAGDGARRTNMKNQYQKQAMMNKKNLDSESFSDEEEHLRKEKLKQL